MRMQCISCGRVTVSKGNSKYCPSCRSEIYNSQKKFGGYANAAKAIIEAHTAEREANEQVRPVRKRVPSIAEVVHQALLNGRSYGHEVAVMEGREY